VIDILKHLQERNLILENYKGIFIDKEKVVVSFLIYNLSGEIVGYQQYDPSKNKIKRNTGKYFTYFQKGKISLWGLDTINYKKKEVYITEGIFKSVRLHNLGLNSLATLTNNPKRLKNQIWILSRIFKVIVICDGDKAGKVLGKYSKNVIYLNDGEYLDEMTVEEIQGKVLFKQLNIKNK
jgi:DNA primase